MKNPKLERNLEATYTAEFFSQHDSSFYLELAEAILSSCNGQHQTTLDVGCGHGFLVEAMRLHGLDARGIEGSQSAEAIWPQAFRHKYQVSDLTRMDDSEVPTCELVTSFEVAEHLDQQFAKRFAEILTCHSPHHVVLGAATVHQDLGRNPTHVNERQFSYWIEQMAGCGYQLHLLKTVELKERLFEKKRTHGVKWWYPKNAMVFVPEASIAGDRKYDQQVADLEPDRLTWRVRSKNTEFNLMADRDRLEYLYIVSEGVSAALKRLR